MSNKEGTHAHHCCIIHGCKYGEKDCPVVNKVVEQVYLCEDCSEDGVTENDLKAVSNGVQLIQPLTGTNKRIETGAAKQIGDWTGVFIRGDNANHYGMLLEQFLNNPDTDDFITKTQLQGLAKLLKSSCE